MNNMQILHKTDLIRAALVGEISFIILAISTATTTSAIDVLNPTLTGVLVLSLALIAPIVTILSMYAAKFISQYIKSALQLMKFALVGVLNTLVDIGLFSILVSLLGASAYLAVATIKVFSFFAAVINSFFWNKFWVFEKGGANFKPQMQELLSFMTISVGGLIANIIVFSVFLFLFSSIEIFTQQYTQIFSALAASLASLFWNFIGYKLIVFKD